MGGELLGAGLNSASLQYSVTDSILAAKTDSITGQSITGARVFAMRSPDQPKTLRPASLACRAVDISARPPRTPSAAS